MLNATKLKKIKILIFLCFLSVVLAFWLLYDLRLLLVVSDSMYPKFKFGDMLLIGKGNYLVAEVITYKFENFDQNLVTHRIIEIQEVDGKKLFYTKGDNSEFVDLLPVNEKEIVGKVFLIFPYFGYLANPVVLALLFYMPMGFILGAKLAGFMLLSKHGSKSAQ